MAHFAQIEDGIVTQVIVVANSDTSDKNGNEVESIGQAFCADLLSGSWLQTSYNSNIRKNYAGIGYSYDKSRDAFIPPKPFESWLLNEDTCLWDAPTPMPDDDQMYTWNEDTQAWDVNAS
jgi:hypothetical protein